MADGISFIEGTFPGPGVTLFRRHVVPPNPWAHLGIIHGYGDHSGRFVHFMRWIAERGVGCHGFDLRGQGRSTGRPGFVRRWEDYLDDLDSFLALDELRSAEPLFLLGHSHGALVLAAAVMRGRVHARACVMTSPFFRNLMVIPRRKKLLARLADPLLPWLAVPGGLSDAWMSSDPAMLADSKADPHVVRVGTPRWYLTTLATQDQVLAHAAEFRSPLLLLFGGADPLADIIAARQFFESSQAHDKTMKVYPGLLHELLREKEREGVFEDVLEWLRARAIQTSVHPRPTGA